MTKIFEKSIQANRGFWKFIKPFLTNKGCTGSGHVSLINNSKINCNDRKVTKAFKGFYINKGRCINISIYGLKSNSVHL